MLEAVRAHQPEVRILPIFCGEMNGAVEFLANGFVDDFARWPTSAEELSARIDRLLCRHLRSETEEVINDLMLSLGLKKLIGRESMFCEALAKVQQISPCDAPVLICGETGTGKELFARAIHYLSPRASKPFVPINCAAIPAELFENELFGHVKGAFTGATVCQEGLIQATAGGTLFLDEIDSIPLLMQAKLLRFLEEKEFKPLGLNRITKADVRIVSAARGDLRKKAYDGSFRDDLFYRLNVVSLFLPPLRERLSDIPLLAEHFLQKYSTQLSKSVTGFGTGVLSEFTQHNWPGNIRELEYTVYHAVAVCQTPTIQVRDLNLPHLHAAESKPTAQSFKKAKAEAVANFERQFITRLLIEHGGNISRAARATHKHRRAFWDLMKKYGINPQTL
ncbi:sigma-54 dependent transcriptional regulator [bacterium]|nr:sigma-54 dependent transcriptional regulator [bacterium]